MTTNQANRLFTETVDEVLRKTWDFYPDMASHLGLHEYDGRLPDLSTTALSRRTRDLEQAIDALERIDTSALDHQSYFDHRMLMPALRHELFDLTELKSHETNPMTAIWHIELSNYIQRDYAPLEERVAALTQALESAIESYEGIVRFYDTDMPTAVQGLGDSEQRRRFDEARRTASGAVQGFVDYLKSLMGEASDSFSIGADSFQKLLRYGEMVEIPLERLLRVGLDDLQRNQVRLREAAAHVDPSASPAEVMARIAGDHPSAEALIPEARAMLEDIRQYLIDHDVISVPSDVRCQVTETPSFMRWAFAAMDIPGAFETKATESYYYVTPVEDHWSDEQKEQWLTSFNYGILKAICIHEAYPGHYVHYLHSRGVPSRVSRVFESYSFSEGWAHYTEEMMLEAGYGSDDPRLTLGQIAEALLRDCRYICAIRMHTQGMTVDEATRFFVENAYMEELPARKEAMRGTFDPMYLNYTLGKLMIMKLRDDYLREQGENFSLKRFHDTFLSFGTPPIPLVREMMLREPGSEVL